MKVFTALLGTETNTFSPFLTGYRNFEQTYLVRGGEHGDRPWSFAVPLIRWREMAQARGWTVVESLAAFAMPAGITRREVYESFRDEILRDLQAAMPVDMVLLNMHGAMVAEGYDDCEGDLTARVRAMVGPTVPIGVELDLHCHLTAQLVEQADVIITFKEYPHVDPPERAEELFTIVADAAQGKVKPHIALYDCRMIGVYHTTREPVKSFVAQMQALEGKDGVLSVSLGHGFPWGDVPDLGTRVLVVTDNQPEKGQALARTLGEQFYAMRDQVQPTYHTMDAALDQALAFAGQPVVLADVADNAGGGAPNDSTFLLRRMLERGVGNAAIGCIWDPVAVQVALEAGEGANLDMRIGGKMGPMSGDPVDLRVRVGRIAHNATQRFGAGTSNLGDAVALHGPNGLDIVVNSQRTQTFSPEVFTNVGIDPHQKKILVVKSMQHFYAGFAPIAAQVYYVAAPGALVPDFTLLPYQKASRNIWPLVA
ncbi:M81 family metallopeptidase [Litorilinea aerophila]|uniref:M81 family metallopeptidase n=1 Tax=Litorilinea aerophila TaxID=1204385 RepID=A0A540VDW2_9CHLR|nr:M81 family metallopeptidase [Litorilinea aerophila]MCC9077273.1 M81 family metallopeptidase [Litorilinea aerophila]